MSSTTFITRFASTGSTVGTRLIVRDTVAVDTFARLAISRMSMDRDLAEFLSHLLQIPSLNQCKHKRPSRPIKIQVAPACKIALQIPLALAFVFVGSGFCRYTSFSIKGGLQPLK